MRSVAQTVERHSVSSVSTIVEMLADRFRVAFAVWLISIAQVMTASASFSRNSAHFWCRSGDDGLCASSGEDHFTNEELRDLIRNVTSLHHSSSLSLSVDASTIRNKVLAGYQGWAGARGTWDHWSADGNAPSPASNNAHFEMVPEISEYPSSSLTPNTGYRYIGNGDVVKLYENAADGVVDLHFQWMKTYGLDGVLVQRFISECTTPGPALTQRNKILAQVDAASAKHGRTYAMMWDMSGGSPTWDTDIANDYNTYVKNYTSHPHYLKEKGKPVVCIFGIGLGDHIQATPSNSLSMIRWLQGQGLYVIGSGPYYWRTGRHDAASGFDKVHAAFDAIMPWSVGRYRTVSDFQKLLPQIEGDAKLTSSRGQDYAPIAYPGYSYRQNHMFNWIKRNGGQFFKAQTDAFLKLQGGLGASFYYIAMFDEVQEGTAIYKFAANESESAAGSHFVTASIDGVNCPGDLYLTMAGQYASAAKGAGPPGPPPPPSVKSELRPGDSLQPGGRLVSDSGKAHLEMQAADGNLVIYDGTMVAWASNTTDHPGAHLDFQGSDGNLVLYDAKTVNVLWSSGPHDGAAKVVLQDDCNLVVLGADSSPFWTLGQKC